MIRILVLLMLLQAGNTMARSLAEKDLSGGWEPSGELPMAKNIKQYRLELTPNLNAEYIALSALGEPTGFRLRCEYKPSDTQYSVFVFYCYLKENHLITLALAGWSSESGQLLYGYEYWLGYPVPGEIHGGIPVSFSKIGK